MTSSLLLGIDTGGTFTDGVLLDPDQHRILQTAKVLTTHHDLKICITQVLDQLVPAGATYQNQISMVSLSTTLVTNAIVEGKSRPTALFLLGYDPDLVYKYDFQKQFGTPHYYFLKGGMDSRGCERAPLDEDEIAGHVEAIKDQVEAFAVSSYGGTINSRHEEQAGEIIARLSGLPVVEGHQLTDRLNSIHRATTASLNAGLLSTAYDFMNTVQAMLQARKIDCPLAVVRGDGSLVREKFAIHRPVEIIHSGPATSAIGGLYLAGCESGLVIDMGGTTTDLALLQQGRVVLSGGDSTVGGYPTSVRTIRSRSFGLGGDSAIHFDAHGAITLGPERVIPLSNLAHAHPEIKQDLFHWLDAAPETFPSDQMEYWVMQREPTQPFTDPRTMKALALLRTGPKRMRWLLKQVGALSPIQVDGDHLVRQDILLRAGLTPTDLLHVTGEYAPWDAEIAHRIVQQAARMAGKAVDAWTMSVREQMTRSIVAEILQFLTGRPLPEESLGRNETLGRWFFDQNFTKADPFLGSNIHLKVPIIGIGAPARAFLPPVADALGVAIYFPEHYQVANAVGTVVGNVLVQKEAEVSPIADGPVITGYLARTANHTQTFTDRDEALLFARQQVSELAHREAVEAGSDRPEVNVEAREQPGGGMLYIAQATGKPGINGVFHREMGL